MVAVTLLLLVISTNSTAPSPGPPTVKVTTYNLWPSGLSATPVAPPCTVMLLTTLFFEVSIMATWPPSGVVRVVEYTHFPSGLTTNPPKGSGGKASRILVTLTFLKVSTTVIVRSPELPIHKGCFWVHR